MSILPTTGATAPAAVALPYVEQGDAGGTPLILLHGLTDSHRSYEPVLAHLPRDIHAYAPTMRGHGDARKPVSRYGGSDFAADIAAFMDAHGIERAVVAGHSLGAWVAGRLAIEYPELVLGLVLAGAFGTFQRPDLGELRAAFAQLSDPVDTAFVRDWQESTLARQVPAGFFETIVAESRKVPARVWAEIAATIVDTPDERFEEIRAPTLLVWGDRDAFVPRSDQDAILAAIPGARIEVHAGGGHAFHWEDPARYAAELARFTRGVAAG